MTNPDMSQRATAEVMAQNGQLGLCQMLEFLADSVGPDSDARARRQIAVGIYRQLSAPGLFPSPPTRQ